MIYKYTCGMCHEDLVNINEDNLVDMVQEHSQNEHDMKMDRNDIRDGIKEEEE